MLCAIALLGVAISYVIVAVAGQWQYFLDSFGLHASIEALGLGLIAWIALGPQPRNGAIWALAWAASLSLFQVLGAAVGGVYEAGGTVLDAPGLAPADLPIGAALAQQALTAGWIPGLFVLLTVFFLLFPDGKPLSARWQWVVRFSVGLIAFSSVMIAWTYRPSSTVPYDTDEFGVAASYGWMALVLVVLAALASVASLVVRYRRSSGISRQQIRWIAWGGSILVLSIAWMVFSSSSETEGGSAAGWVALVGILILIGSIGMAITKYRLYDIDIVISRTVTYGALGLFITAVYVAIVVGVGAVAGQGDEPNLALAIAATAVVALLFQPVRSRVQLWANRLVYGERATPYSVLSELTARLSEAQSNEQALGRLAELIASGTGAEEAVVWLRVGDRLRPEAMTSSETPQPVAFSGNGLPELPGDAAESIHHGGELLGALSITKAKGDPATPSDRQLLQDVAAGAGLLLRNIQLNAELATRAEELRSSRRRLIAAQDSERRRLERNLHDGAQQQVVALKVKLGLARTLAQREGAPQVAAAVGDLTDDSQRAVDGMRAAARGIYPPLLEAEGVRAALVAAGREAAIPVDIAADGFGRYPPEIEATVYFCVLEALGHASKGSPNVARVSLGDDGEGLTFSVHNASHGSGRGPGLTAVADRLEALGGTLIVEATPGGGTVVTGRLPARSLEPI